MRLDQIESIVRHHPQLVSVDDYEVVQQEHSGIRYLYRNGESCAEATEFSNWTSLRVVQRKQPGFAVMTVSNGEDVQELIAHAMFSSQHACPDPWFRFPRWRGLSPDPPTSDVEFQIPQPNFLTPETRDLDTWETHENWKVETRILRKTERHIQRHTGQVSTEHIRLCARSTAGSLNLLKVGAGSLSKLDANLVPVFLELSKAPPAEKISPGPVLVSSCVASEMIRLFSRFFIAGRGPDLASRSFPSCVTLKDEGNHPEGLIRGPFDLEGVSTQKTVVMDAGEPALKLCDSYHGARLNQLSTGNRFRAGSALWPGVIPSTFYLEAGTKAAVDLFRSIKQGTIIHSLLSIECSDRNPRHVRAKCMGWIVTPQANLVPFSNLDLCFDLIDTMNHVVEAANDIEFFGGFGSPSILIERMP